MRTARRHPLTGRTPSLLAAAVLLGSVALVPGVGLSGSAHAAPGADGLLSADAIAPVAGEYGHYVDVWDTNTDTDLDPRRNAAVGVLSSMLDVWTPGEEWDSGTPVQQAVTDSNIDQSVAISKGASDAEQQRAYAIDRRHQNYTATEGMDELTDAYRSAVNAGTTIPDEVPEEAKEKKLDDGSNENGVWADPVGELGPTVQLVNDIRNHSATSNNAKAYYQYPRPFRWSEEVDMPEYALPLMKPESEAASDGGFPSGHTSAGHMATYGLAHAFPQQYDDFLLKAAEIGTSRIELGMHSPLDVMGGRLLSTAITTGALNDPALEASADSALAAGQEWLAGQDTDAVAQRTDGIVTDEDRAAYDSALAEYTQYLTFGFEQTGDTTVPMRVPKGAEALIETRYPYLDEEQRRWLLHSTGIESGYPALDDAEGFGRLNMFAAQAGFGRFDTDLVVTMGADDAAAAGAAADTEAADDAAAGANPFATADEWLGDIAGAGSLTLDGSGLLVLAGENTYSGGTTLTGGTLVAATTSAFGTGDLTVDGGVLEVSGDALAAGPVTVDGELALGGGTLRVTLPEGADLSAGIPVLAGSAVQGEFSDLEVVGAPEDAELSLEYANGQVLLVVGAQDDATQEPAPTQTGEPTEAPTSEPTSTPTDDATQSPDEDGQDDGRDEDARGDDQLPRTGAQVTALVGIALALVAGGTAALTIARRRRI
jgi:autotransporter-associated beta strand protein